MNGGVDKTKFKSMIGREYQMSYRETILMEIKDLGKVKDEEYLSELVEKRSKKIEAELEEYIHVTYLINLLLSRIRTILYCEENVPYVRDRNATTSEINIASICKQLTKEAKIDWNETQIIEARKVISDKLMQTISNHICVDEKMLEPIKAIVLGGVKPDDDAWLCDLYWMKTDHHSTVHV